MREDRRLLDLLIIGVGPIGLNCGICCAAAGLSFAIIEKGVLVNSLYHYPQNMTFFSTSDRLEIGGVPFISHHSKPTRSKALEYYRRVTMQWKLPVHLYEEVLSVERQENGNFRTLTSRQSWDSRAVVIASGFYDIPHLMQISGETLSKVHHYYQDPHPYFGQRLIVVGAANSAVDVALETWRKGAYVTIVVREPSISESVKYWVRPDIENRIRDGDIKAYFNTEITDIREREVELLTPQGILNIENDFVLAMTGYLPNFSFLQRCGIHLQDNAHRTPVHDPETMETNIPRLYLAGVICGGMQTNQWFIENSRVHSQKIIQHLLKVKV